MLHPLVVATHRVEYFHPLNVSFVYTIASRNALVSVTGDQRVPTPTLAYNASIVWCIRRHHAGTTRRGPVSNPRWLLVQATCAVHKLPSETNRTEREGAAEPA